MGSVYKRKNKLYICYKDSAGKWRDKGTGLDVGQEDAARKVLKQVEARIAAGSEFGGGEVTVRRYAKRWLEERRKRGLRSVDDDEARLTKHVFPSMGEMKLGDVRPRHMVDLLRRLGAGKQHAPRTIRNVYAVVRNMYADALVDELVDSSPCILKSHHLPANVDRDPAWRDGAIFTLEEAQTLIGDPRIPLVRQTLYAFLLLSGARIGEVTARRWADIDFTCTPLGKIGITSNYNTKAKREMSATKVTGVVRYAPLHPCLDQLLRSWRLQGWEDFTGRPPEATDLVFPNAKGGCRSNDAVHHAFVDDLAALQMRRRRVHDLRRSFVSLARSAGAREDIVQWITHGPGRKIVDIYTTFPWSALCTEVQKIALRPPVAAPVLEFPALPAHPTKPHPLGPNEKLAASS